MNIRKRQFTNTKAALIEYDAGAPARNKAWNDVACDADVGAVEAVDKAALAKVQQAFYRDTSDINSPDHCALVDLGFMRRMAKDDE